MRSPALFTSLTRGYKRAWLRAAEPAHTGG
jgi:hypothetical protein